MHVACQRQFCFLLLGQALTLASTTACDTSPCDMLNTDLTVVCAEQWPQRHLRHGTGTLPHPCALYYWDDGPEFSVKGLGWGPVISKHLVIQKT